MGNKVKFSDMPKWDRFEYISSFILLALSLGTAFVLIKLTLMVVNKIGSKDRVIVGMMSCLTLACFGKSLMTWFYLSCLASVFFWSFSINETSYPNRENPYYRKPF
jgi:hypothetical protein